eukprot:6364452-Amphidinium_carterae.1
MTIQEVILSLGHGLVGVLPRIPGTVSTLSLWENGLEGHMPELQIHESSVILAHANVFSCNLPRNGEVELKSSHASLALIGNHFAASPQIPPWITRAERPSDMFCVSNQQCKHFLMFLACGVCLFGLASLAGLVDLQ